VTHCGWIAGAVLGFIFCLGSAEPAAAAAINFQPAVTQMMAEITEFHNYLLYIITAVSLLVLGLLIWVALFYNRRANPTPKKFTHNMTVEVIWTIVPVLILVAIAWKSFPLIFKAEQIPPAELTLKVTGNSWFWNFEYPDLDVAITSVRLEQADAEAQGRPYLLAVDTPLLVPEDTTIEVLVTSNDVIHSFAVPAFGIKEDAIQGRTNDTWFRVESSLLTDTRTFYGQCSELCGKDHAFMPLEIHVVPRAEFNERVASLGGNSSFSANPNPNSIQAAERLGARAEAPAR
jgi:cytochrome c oxidase subunit 2